MSYNKIMKSIIRIFASFVVAFLFLLTPQNSFASSSDFYFDDAIFDYYLENTDSGTTMRVKETLTAVFSDADQNHGIVRAIPYTNVDGKNITVENPDALNLKVSRNGNPETISKITKDEDEFIVYIGTANTFVHGVQVYTLEYEFKNVITEFNNSNENVTGQHSADVNHQELYWDTNGTGWSQKFNHLVANIHLSSSQSKAMLGDLTSCYVGIQGSSNVNGKRVSSRCSVTSDDETTFDVFSLKSDSAIKTDANSSETILTFEAVDILPHENLTFAIAFQPGTFNVPDLPRNYILVIIFTIVSIICVCIITLFILAYIKKARKNRKYYKGLFVAPQYTPPKDLDIAESAILYPKNTKNSYVATLLELAVSGKITLIKGEPTKILKKDTWVIKLNDTTNLTNSQFDLLKLLSGGTDPSKVPEGIIFVEKHTPTAELEALSKDYYKDAGKSLHAHGFLEKPVKSKPGSGGVKVITIFIIAAILMFIAYTIPNFIGTLLSKQNIDFTHGVVIGQTILPIVTGIIVIAAIVICTMFGILTSRYKKYTEKGLDMANYLEGLYLYIKMAETDRIKFLQSVKGADTSAKGIIKLYEKLLPYACLFGLEESWLSELSKYCHEVNYSPNWYSGDDFITFYALSSINSSVRSSIMSSSNYSNSSYSGSGSGGSSFSSGIGGGFSGGGGGGGGGGGW